MIAELFSSVWVWLLIAGLSGSCLLFTRQRSPLPIINDYPGDFLRIKAYKAYFKDPKKLLADGFAKFKGPFMVLAPWGSKIVLPNSLSDWVKLNRDLDHQELVREEYFARYSGFEAQYAIHSPDRMLIEVLRTKLSQNEGASVLPTVSRHVALALEEHWGNDGDSWNTINWEKDTTGLISYAAASVFIGPEMATNPKWQRITQTYVRDVFAAVGMLQMYPRTLRPIVHQFLPQSSSCRALVREARAVVGKVIEKRAQEAAVAAAQGQEPPHHNDALAWMQKAQPEFNNTLDLADLQLGLAMAALFTTAEALRQVLIDVAQHPELVDPLRQEISGALSNHGIGQTALNEMELLDSVMKESQRLFPLLLSLERHAVRDVTLPDGTKIPKGSQILVDSSDMWNPKVYEDPDSYDGYRFLKRRQAGDKSAQYVQSSLEHQVFGRGRHICPGRFFATNELKLCLAHILTKYDIRLKQGYEPRPMQFGFFAIVDPGVQLEVRRRDKGSADTML